MNVSLYLLFSDTSLASLIETIGIDACDAFVARDIIGEVIKVGSTGLIVPRCCL